MAKNENKDQKNSIETTRVDENSKNQQLENFREDPNEQYLTTDQGVRISRTDDSLKAGSRGPTLMEDFHFREKMTHLDHESIPERVVHARGSGAHGYFQVYESMADLTKAKFLQDPSQKTPVFVRFSTVVGSRGSADTVRDVRGFATKFYTQEGNYDLVGNNIPVFFIQDAIKFPDLVHAIKPQPDKEMPQASAAHDTFWDFASLMPETAHMLMWVLSDRAIPRSFRMMEGFGVHTFRLVNAQGEGSFVKFHWKPLLGVHSLVWDEAQKLAGKDPDWLRRDLWEAIETGEYPEFELGIQMIPEGDEHAFAFDILDATKLIPEELVPVRRIGKMTLNRNPDNFFAETEQVAFHPGNVVPGIDFTNDPLLQGRLFSYVDTQINRFHSSNFTEVPINRPVVPVHNQQGAGFMRQTINKGKVNYFPNSLGGGYPKMASEQEGGYVHYTEKVEGHKIRERSKSFKDHFSQATLFWKSMSAGEKKRIVQALHFELGKVESKEVRIRMVNEILNHISYELATMVAQGIGVDAPSIAVGSKVKDVAGTIKDKAVHALSGGKTVEDSPALSIDRNNKSNSIKSRKVAILADNGFSNIEVMSVKQALQTQGAKVSLVSMFKGKIKSTEGEELEVDKSHITTGSIMFDAIFIPGGKESVEKLKKQGEALHVINEAYKHGKPIGAINEGIELLMASSIGQAITIASAEEKRKPVVEKGIVTLQNSQDFTAFNEAFIQAIAQHRHIVVREERAMVPA
ncbi:catalase [Rhodocytophaga aerolata]|uniref:Catalase n=1 Tax=Rhodocytophaga aerolata TaxID=455078 RepID=A0ABT8RCL7_9BACT|nr:catalase [Rhodocytophaga aerolata]MDO1449852.1 catalase [Rhodocytophaga aerolata]